MLEDFVEAVFTGTLNAVTEKRRGPAKEDAADALLSID
jgi:hypothetical protein